MFTVVINGGAMPYLIVHLNLREPDANTPRVAPTPDGGLLTSDHDDDAENMSLIGGIKSHVDPKNVAVGASKAKHMCAPRVGRARLAPARFLSSPAQLHFTFSDPPNNPRRGLRDSIYDFQRTGGIQERFKVLDKHLGKVLISTDPTRSGHGRSAHGPHGPHELHGEVEMASSTLTPSTTMRRSAGELPYDLPHHDKR